MISNVHEQIEKNRAKIEKWFDEKFEGLRPPIYASVDIRNSHHKIAVVDTNVFPAGFNNLCPNYNRQVVEAFRDYLGAHFPSTKSVMLLPELHTRNRFYLENTRCLAAAIVSAGYDVRVGSLDPELRTSSVTLDAMNGDITMEKVERSGDEIGTDGFLPDLVISNNDFSGGVPDMLSGLSQTVVPYPDLGWHRRRKSNHFRIMNELIEDFGKASGISPWCISTYVSRVGEVDFNDEASREKVADETDTLRAFIQAEYDCRSIEDRPLLFIKDDSGTYGMAVMTAGTGDDVRTAKRKTRVKMGTGKGKTPVTGVIIQEGIATKDEIDDSPMEPVIYMVGRTPVGGFYRLHKSRSESENLNVRGMEFHRLCFHQVSEKKPEKLDDRCEDAGQLLNVYGTLGKIAVLAVAIEMKELEEQG